MLQINQACCYLALAQPFNTETHHGDPIAFKISHDPEDDSFHVTKPKLSRMVFPVVDDGEMDQVGLPGNLRNADPAVMNGFKEFIKHRTGGTKEAGIYGLEE